MIGNCSTCTHISTDDAGDDFFSYPFDVCEKIPRMSNLKSFPFKKSMPCHELNFWHSEFASRINGDPANDDKVFADFKLNYPSGGER